MAGRSKASPKKSKKVIKNSALKTSRHIKDNPLVTLSAFVYKRWKITLMLWVFLLGFGALTYTSLIKREGFPPIQFPLSVVNGTYFVDDKDKVDTDLAQPLYNQLKDIPEVNDVTTTAGANFLTAVVEFDSEVHSAVANQIVADAIKEATDNGLFPEQAQLQSMAIDPAGFLNEFDMLLSVYSTDESTPVSDIEAAAEYVLAEFVAEDSISNGEVKSLLETAQTPDGSQETRQTSFNIIGLKDGAELQFSKAVTIGIDRDSEKVDIIELSELAKEKIEQLDLSGFGDSFRVVIGADFAESIKTQISSLQSNLTTGLLAVALVSFLLITWRASIITGLYMVTVIAVSIVVLYLIGYTLNTITLFALVLSLGLFVDDATIVVESIDAGRRKKQSKVEIIKTAIRQIGSASFAGTFTTVLVFLPLAFIGGILGEFIRLMPITIIISLITSLVLSLTVIPVLAKFLLLRSDKVSLITRLNPLTKLEAWLGEKAGNLPRLLKTKTKSSKMIAFALFSLSILFLMVSGSYLQKLSFNIFPPTKDSDQIGFQINYPNGYTIADAESVARDINDSVREVVGENAEKVLYGSFQQPNNRSADAIVQLTSFRERDIKSPEIMSLLQENIDDRVPDGVSVRVLQYDAGPPVEEYPLSIQIREEDFEKAVTLAQAVQTHIDDARLERLNGTEFNIIDTKLDIVRSVTRVNGSRTLTVSGAFDDTDVSAMLQASKEYVEQKFDNEYLENHGYSDEVLGFDFGQESENADSFASLAYAFPVALLLMYILLALQFRSFLQPILIFVAIPFTLFGVFAGLYYTDNALSFFAVVGLVGLIGIAVNNTILLTSYANQEKRAGESTIDAISNAVQKRFRPLVATTLTTVVALLPLALSDPFWEGLAFTIIFGLVSSTILVILSFPYYYLGAEWLRMRVSKGTRAARKKAKTSI